MDAVSSRTSVAAGSVWETRMKSDEVRGGVKVFNGDQIPQESGVSNNNVAATKLKRTQVGVTVPTGKRKTWKSEGSEKSPIQLNRRGKTEQKQSNAVKSPIPVRKLVKTEERSPVHKTRKIRSEEEEQNGTSLRNSKSDSITTENRPAKGAEGGSVQLRKTKSELDHDPPRNENESDGGGIENAIIESGKNGESGEDCKDFGVCQEKVISTSTSPELSLHVDGDSDDEGEEEEHEDEDEDEAEEEVDEDEEIDVKEISIPESKVVIEPEKKVILKEPEPKKKILNEPEPKKIVTRRFQQRNQRPVSVPITVNQSPPIRRNSTIYQNFSKSNHSIPKTGEYRSFPQNHNKLQSLVDLIMWRDISRSVFIFGIGTFAIVSSSYAKDINLSLISVTSYMGLVYLAVIFLYRSLICRGVIDVDNNANYVLGEEEAIWVLKLILPYLNEFLSRLKAMFSGDPGTTIKLAVLLFVLARCGSSITIWKMAKFGFFGVFTVPKICSSYSSQLTAYGNFWIRRFRDAWDSCSHKKAVALGIFGLVWNLSTVVARVWAVFVLFVAFRYYQQHYLVRDEYWVEVEVEVEDEAGCGETWQQDRQAFVDTNKVKKGF